MVIGMVKVKVKVKVGAKLNRFRFALGRKMPSLCVVWSGDSKMASTLDRAGGFEKERGARVKGTAE